MSLSVDVKNLKKEFNGLEILKGATFKVEAGDSCSIMGSSGGGKSVLLQSICGLMDYDTGSIKIGDTEMSHTIFRNRFSDLNIGYLFQDSALIDYMTAIENVAFYHMYSQRLPRHEAFKIARKFLDMVEVTPKYFDLYPSHISGGTKKRVALARALAMNIDLLLLDEPDSGLDPVNTRKITDLIQNIRSQNNMTVIAITHDLNTAMNIGNNIHFLSGGVIKWSGKNKDIFKSKDPDVTEFIQAAKVDTAKFG